MRLIRTFGNDLYLCDVLSHAYPVRQETRTRDAAMEAEGLTILLTVCAALGVHLWVRWYLRRGMLPRAEPWLA